LFREKYKKNSEKLKSLIPTSAFWKNSGKNLGKRKNLGYLLVL
jgi:hypothetical protein